MKANLTVICFALLLSACSHRETNPTVISLTYTGNDIQKQFDTLYNYQQVKPGVYSGLIEQALAGCHRDTTSTDTIVQDVFSSMYLNKKAGVYDCITNTTFRFHDGTITAAGVFNLTPGDTIAPNHNFPIIGGSAAYRDIYGTYTRQYKNGVYHVELKYYKLK
ncbi:hypothetical protein ACFGVR_10065 [Mucilaginibacter sp. AW1-3]